MSKPKRNIEESLSIAYSTAVLAKSGLSINYIDEDYGTDISVRDIQKYENQFIDMGAIFDCQLKASINWINEADHIVYDMKVKAYNKLVLQNKKSTTPIFLILLCLPKEEKEWIGITTDELMLRNCCYYFFINGHLSDNTDQVRIRIPKINKFHPNEITSLVKHIESGAFTK